MKNMRSEAGSWTWFILAGIVVFVLLGLHMLIIHLDGILGIFNPAGGSALSWDNVIARSHSGFFEVTYIILLAAALYHGLYGLRTIVFELGLKRTCQRYWTLALWIVGIVLFIVGTYAAIAVQSVKVM
jgi:succinate dehydrogenase / fumarate reductase membrane anchor subunit